MMDMVAARKQHGLTFVNFILIAILVVFLAIFGMKIVPAFVENRTIVHILDSIAHAPEMQDALPSDIRNSYEKHALVNNITVIGSNDIVIQRTPNGLVLSVKYSVKIGLVGNASLVLDFDASSSRPR
ncbi:MAG TPA: DUF4845 domain-containing protein [Gallionellaceae bacterium]